MPTLTETLKNARKARRYSQLELSLRLGVSQRHVSFVESGRSNPSRGLLIAWLQELEAPLPLRNAALLSAGYAPAYPATPLESSEMLQVREALIQLLENHDPMPAYVLDPLWNLPLYNRGAEWLLTAVLPWLADGPPGATLNLLDLMLHPDGLAKHITNLSEVGPPLLAHLRAEAAHHPELLSKAELLARGLGAGAGRADAIASPVLTTRFATVHGELSFFSMFTTFGSPQDITPASLRVEHLFAADQHTRGVMFRFLAPPRS